MNAEAKYLAVLSGEGPSVLRNMYHLVSFTVTQTQTDSGLLLLLLDVSMKTQRSVTPQSTLALTYARFLSLKPGQN